MQQKTTNGITLIALVVTIIVLIILATISINAVFGDNGLIKKAEQSREKQALAEELERLELIKGEVLTDAKNKGKISVDIYVDELIAKGIVDPADVTVESDGSKTLITDAGYEVNIAPDGNHNVIITINGKAESVVLMPKINNVTTSLEAVSEIGITIDATNADSYEIQYKKSSDANYATAYSGSNNSYTIKGLDENAIYNIRIIVTNSYGSRIRDINARAGVPSGVGAITFTDFAWKSGKAEVKINKTTTESYEMRYRVEDSTGTEKVEYTVIASGAIIGNLNYGDLVEAQLWNGSIGGSTATFNVGDTIEPNTATLTYYDDKDVEITGNIEIENGATIKIKVEQSDNESGVEITNCKWVIDTNSGSIGTEESNYTGGTFTTTPEEITFTQTTADEYYLHILTIDKAGNKKETISKMIKVKKPTPAGEMAQIPITWTSTHITPISDGNGGVIPLPSGFYYVGGDIKEGIVISDEQADANKGTSYEVASTLVGNQFVWIPVSSESDLERTNFDSNGNPTSSAPSSGYSVSYCKEPYRGGYSDGAGTQEIAEYNTMKTQVLQYGGFYIGRYEAGDGTNGTTLRSNATTAHTVVCKKGVAPYNYVPWGKSLSNVSEIEGKSGAVYLSKKMYESSQSVTSTLIYGCQWDAMCRYIENSQRATLNKTAPELTGSVEKDVSKNIYDLAGNCIEWTMELGTNRITRGGYYYVWDEPIYHRNPYRSADDVAVFTTFRCSLYIK